MLKTLALFAFAFDLASAYGSSIEDCEEFAAKWNGNCGGTDEDSVYTESDWETSGSGATVLTCSTVEDEDENDIEVLAPNTGSTVTSYTLLARNCITCN